jgi:hypothetical protein
MKIGIMGSGRIGSNLAHGLVEAGHEVALANSRGPESLTSLVAEIGAGAHARTVEEAAEFGEVVVEAIPFGEVPSLPAPALAGQILVTASNYYPDRDGEIDLDDLTQSEWVARHLPRARVVKAFNTIYFEHLRDSGDTSLSEEDRRVVPLAGDDDEAKVVVAGLIRDLGFGPLDMGGLRRGGRRMEPGSPIYNRELSVGEAKEVLAG